MATFTWGTPTVNSVVTKQGVVTQITGNVVTASSTAGTVGTYVGLTGKIPMGITHGAIALYVTGKATTQAVSLSVGPATAAGNTAWTLVTASPTTAATDTVGSAWSQLFGVTNTLWFNQSMRLSLNVAATDSTATAAYEIMLYAPNA